MATLDNIIGNYHVIKEGGLTHKRHFLNMKMISRDCWYNRRRHGIKS